MSDVHNARNVVESSGIIHSRSNLRREQSQNFLHMDGIASVRHRARGFTLRDLRRRTFKNLIKLLENIKQQEQLDEDPGYKDFISKMNNVFYGKFTERGLECFSLMKKLVNKHYILFKEVFEDLRLLAEALEIAGLEGKTSLIRKLRADLKRARSKEIDHCEKMPLTSAGIGQFINTLKGVLKFKKNLKWQTPL